MATSLPVEAVRQQNWLEPVAECLQPALILAVGACATGIGSQDIRFPGTIRGDALTSCRIP